MDDVLNWFVELASEVAKRRPSRDDRYTETLSWERLYTSLDEAKLTAFAERCKASPYTALLVSTSVFHLKFCLLFVFVFFAEFPFHEMLLLVEIINLYLKRVPL